MLEGAGATRRQLDLLILREAEGRRGDEVSALVQAGSAPNPSYLATYLGEMESGATEEDALKVLQDMHADDEAAVLQHLILEAEKQAEPPNTLVDSELVWLEGISTNWRKRLAGTVETPRSHSLLRQVPRTAAAHQPLPAAHEAPPPLPAPGTPATAFPRPGTRLSPQAPSTPRPWPPASPVGARPLALATLGLGQSNTPTLNAQGRANTAASSYADLIRLPASRREGHAGAGDAAELAGAIGTALGTHLEPALRLGLAPISNVLDAFRRQNEDDKASAEGTLGYLRGHARWYVFLARGCDEMEVSLCEGLHVRGLYDGLRRAGDGARALLTMVKWPVPINVRIAYGFAGGCHGGRDLETLPE